MTFQQGQGGGVSPLGATGLSVALAASVAGHEPHLRTSPDQVPPEPWVAVRIEVGAAVMPEAMAWTGDLERCLAWAWIERP